MISFLTQYQRLRENTPRMALVNLQHENSDYCNWCAQNKNSYMLYGSELNDTALYGTWIYNSKDCVDCDFSYKCELCFMCLDCEGCYNCNYCQDCEQCSGCSFCYDCVSCTDCFGCVGLRHKRFYVFNEQCNSEEEYRQRVKQIQSSGIGSVYKTFSKLQRTVPRKFIHEKQIENCSGDYIRTSRNTQHSFDVRDLEDCLYMNSSIGAKDSVDCSNIYFDCEQNHEIMSAIGIKQCVFCSLVYYSEGLLYCEQLWNCHDCMLSTTLKRKEYCILNQPYSKESYFKKKDEIIAQMKLEGEWGRYLESTYPEPLVYGL